jgi:hypothetical protein
VIIALYIAVIWHITSRTSFSRFSDASFFRFFGASFSRFFGASFSRFFSAASSAFACFDCFFRAASSALWAQRQNVSSEQIGFLAFGPQKFQALADPLITSLYSAPCSR